MNMKKLKAVVLALGGALTLTSGAVLAQDKPASLQQLLQKVEQGRVAEARENREREQRFLADKSQQQRLLTEANQTREKEEQRSSELEKKFEENELLVAEKRRQMRERMGALTELFGHLTASAGDLRSTINSSLISAQYPGREKFVDELIAKMSGAEQLPSIEEIERLWFELQREMTESGRVVKFTTNVIESGGAAEQAEVVRIGTFNIVDSQGRYLQYVPETGALSVLARQPSGPYNKWGRELASAAPDSGMHRFGIDPTGPTGGTYLAALIDSPTLVERWHQGGVIGYIITAIGIFGVLLALWRLLVLTSTNSRVNAQLKSASANANNPLGRVLQVREQHPDLDPEALELKLDEAVMKEVPRLEMALNLLKVIAAVGPLLGLLGTVTGMIITFQAITIFGAGDPKAMSGGISAALVTTVLGLCVAIPVVLLHTIVSGRAGRVINILEEQSAGIIAERTEAQQGKR